MADSTIFNSSNQNLNQVKNARKLQTEGN
jgi:hypothetical protein